MRLELMHKAVTRTAQPRHVLQVLCPMPPPLYSLVMDEARDEVVIRQRDGSLADFTFGCTCTGPSWWRDGSERDVGGKDMSQEGIRCLQVVCCCHVVTSTSATRLEFLSYLIRNLVLVMKGKTFLILK